MFLVKLKTWNMLHRAYRAIMVLSSILVSTQFFNMINIVKRTQCLNDLPVGLVLFQLCAEDGEGDGVHAQTGTHIRLIRLDVINTQTKLTADSNEIAQVVAVLQLQMNLEMVGAVIQVHLNGREPCEDAQEQHIHDDAQGVLSGTDDKAKEAAEPQSSRGGQTLDLAPGAEDDGVAGKHSCGDDGGSGKKRETDAVFLHQIQVQDHGYAGGEGHQHKGTQTCGVPLAGTLAADDGGQDDDGHKAEQDGIGGKLHRPAAQHFGNGISQCKQGYLFQNAPLFLLYRLGLGIPVIA